MAIRASERRTSEIEYENTYNKVYAYITERVKHLPRRHMHYIGRPMNESLNRIYEKIMRCTDYYIHGKGKSAERQRLCEEIVKEFEAVIEFSYFWWNVCGDKDNEIKYLKQNQREYWAELVNKELQLLSGVARKCGRRKKGIDVPAMKAYTRGYIRDVVFLEKLEELQRTIYRRAIRQGKDYRDAQMEMLMQLSRHAFYNALEGNEIYVSCEADYKRRKRYISEAVGNLYAMNRPVRELAFNGLWPEEELEKICNLVTDCIKLLKAVQNSDKERLAEIA